MAARFSLALQCLAAFCVITVALAAALGVVARAANPPAVQKYYVPFPEDQLLVCFTNIWFDRTPTYTTTPQTLPPVNPMTTYLTITVNAAGTLVYYDHWEDGYEPNIDSSVQPSTEVWGDGNPANGSAPGFVSDILAAGDVIRLYNQLDSRTLQVVLDYDGRDKIGATKSIAVSRTGWSTGPETLMAGAIEVFSTGIWGTDYRAPVGENIPDSTSNDQFDYVALVISAGEGGAAVKVDLNGDDDFSDTGDIPDTNPLVLAEGESYLVDGGVLLGCHVVSFDPANPANPGNPVQVVLLAGDEGSNYETRDSSLLPTTAWSTSYYTPVSTATSVSWTGWSDPFTPQTVVWLYNPNSVAITVNTERRIGTGAISLGSVSVPSRSYAKVALPENSAYRFYNTSDYRFYGFSCTDANSTQTAGGASVAQANQAWDWGFSLIPASSLSAEFQCGLGIGRDPTAVLNPTENGNPVWVTTVGNPDTNNNGQKDDTVFVYVDYNGDGIWNNYGVGGHSNPGLDPNGNGYDIRYSLLELQQQKLFDGDGDQTGMRVYTLTPGVLLVGAWGQDPRVASPSTPGLDVGTSIPPLARAIAGKTANLVEDPDADGLISPGDTIEYDVRAVNASLGSLFGGVVLVDNLPTDTVYVAGSARYRVSTDGGLGWDDWVEIFDDGSGTPFPLDGNGLAIQQTLPVREEFQIVFQVTIEDFQDLDPDRTEIVNEGAVRFPDYSLIIPLYRSDPLYGSLGDRVWNDLDNDGVQDSGEPGLNGVRVFIDANDNGVYDSGEPSDITFGNGDYLISGLPAGTYTVRVDTSTLDDDFGRTYDLDGTATPDVAAVPLAGGQDRIDADFGYHASASLGDRVWLDLDGDAAQESGEPGINGVRVYIDSDGDNVWDYEAFTDTNGSGRWDLGEPLTDTNGNGVWDGEPNAITAGDGNYNIGNLTPGTPYVVRVDTPTLPSGLTQTHDLGHPPLDHEATPVTLGVGENRTDVDFGYKGTPPVYSLGDLVWQDFDGRGRQTVNVISGNLDLNGDAASNEGDDGWLGFKVNIIGGRADLNGDGSVDATDDGFLGTIRVKDGYLDMDNDNNSVFQGINVITGRLDMSGNGTVGAEDTGSVTVQIQVIDGRLDVNGSGSVSTADNSFFRGYPVIGGRIDFNKSGTITSTDNGTVNVTTGLGIPGVRVFIDRNGDGVWDATEPFAITDANGNYTIGNLPAGTYTVRVDTSTLPVGSIQTYDLDGVWTAHVASATITTANRTDVDFGYRDRASLGDRVWNDVSNYGVQDSTETGIPDVRVYIDKNGDNLYTFGEPFAITDANGYYAIGDLDPGTYSVRVDLNTLPSGALHTYDLDNGTTNPNHEASRTLSSGDNADNVDFGYRLTATGSVGDFVWLDLNGNGVWNTGEPGIEGVRVYIDSNSNGMYDSGEPSDITDASGLYLIDNLVQGTYTVRVDPSALPAGVTQTYDLNGTLDHRADIGLETGEHRIDVDYGYAPPARIGDYVWVDANGNGVQESGEAPLPGVSVQIYRASDNAQMGSDTTDANGAWEVGGLLPGTYHVKFTAPSGYGFSPADQGGNDGQDTDANPSTGQTGNYTLTVGQYNQTVDAGLYQPASIGDYTWVDANGDGVQNSGEPPLPGVLVEVYRTSDNALMDSDTSGASGAWNVSGLAPGTYYVKFTLPGGYSFTSADAGSDTADSDANPGTGQTGNYTLVSGETNQSVDAGAVWYDFADLPDTGSGTGAGNYQTLLADGAPYHNISLGALYLGAAVDPEADGQPNATANGDDLAAQDDEDGVVLPVFTAGQTATIQITSSDGGYVNAFIDWNGDGDFLDEGEDLTAQAVTSDPNGLPVVAGLNTLTVAVPPGAVTGDLLGAIFRVSSAGGLGPTGYAPDGEVETYLVAVAPSDVCPAGKRSPWTGALWNPTLNNGAGGFVSDILEFDWASNGSANLEGLDVLLDGSADPAPGTKFVLRYQSKLAGVVLTDGNALPLDDSSFEYTMVMEIPMEAYEHAVGETLPEYPNTLTFRTADSGRFYMYYDTAPNSTVSNGLGFDDGLLVATGVLEVDRSGSITITSASTGLGSFTVRGTVAYVNPAHFNVAEIIDGISVSLSLTYPPGDSDTDECFRGRSGEGNLVDYIVKAEDLVLKADASSRFTLCADYGDLPDTYGTTFSQDGARHYIAGVYLGPTASPDADSDGQPTPTAIGDDVNGNDDEDGAVFAGALQAGQLATATVTASAPGVLNVWADWNDNGVFDTAERVFADQLLIGGPNSLSFTVPADAVLDSTAFRFRFTDTTGQGGDSPTGLAFSGEVEDYTVSVPTAATLKRFRATTLDGRVMLSWQTLGEVDMLGFHLERATADGDWDRITSRVIPAEAFDFQPHDYRYHDASVGVAVGGEYRLLAVDLHGAETVLAQATIQRGFLLMIERIATGLQVKVEGPSVTRIVVEATTDVAKGSWQGIGTVELDSTGQGGFRVEASAPMPVRFYRVREQ